MVAEIRGPRREQYDALTLEAIDTYRRTGMTHVRELVIKEWNRDFASAIRARQERMQEFKNKNIPLEEVINNINDNQKFFDEMLVEENNSRLEDPVFPDDINIECAHIYDFVIECCRAVTEFKFLLISDEPRRLALGFTFGNDETNQVKNISMRIRSARRSLPVFSKVIKSRDIDGLIESLKDIIREYPRDGGIDLSTASLSEITEEVIIITQQKQEEENAQINSESRGSFRLQDQG